jgi:GAF domain-containing protein
MDLKQATHLASMALDMTDQPDVKSALNRIVHNAQVGLCCDAVGILLAKDRGKVVTAAATEGSVRSADDVQLACGEGPGLAALWTDETFLVSDTRDEPRWPAWSAHASDLGWRSVLTNRLFTPDRTLGAVSFYSRAEHAFDESDVDLAQIFARYASIALLSAQNGDSLRQAISARHVIGQAQGILMERYQIDADRAFAVLRRYSQDRNVKLRTVAEHVIANHRMPE